MISMTSSFNGKRPSTPLDLRETGTPDDPLFKRPLVYGRIDTGVVEVRRPGSDEVERREIGSTRSRKESKTMVQEAQDQAAETKVASHGASGDTGNKLDTVARLYIDGATYAEIARITGIHPGTVHYYVRKARDAGLIKETRGKGQASKRPSQDDAPAPSAPTPQVDKGGELRCDDLLDRIAKIEERLDQLASERPQPSPGIAVLEDISRELDQIKRDVDILAGGLAEVSRRVQGLEETPATGGSDMTRELLRLLEVALVGDRRRIA